MNARQQIERLEQHAPLLEGEGDRFSGYAIIGLPFHSGHILALRRFFVSTIGPGYTSVWHRDPSGRWTFYSTVAPDLACARYFGREVRRNVVARPRPFPQSSTGSTLVLPDRSPSRLR